MCVAIKLKLQKLTKKIYEYSISNDISNNCMK